jgi:hypothetical protein
VLPEEPPHHSTIASARRVIDVEPHEAVFMDAAAAGGGGRRVFAIGRVRPLVIGSTLRSLPVGEPHVARVVD